MLNICILFKVKDVCIYISGKINEYTKDYDGSKYSILIISNENNNFLK